MSQEDPKKILKAKDHESSRSTEIAEEMAKPSALRSGTTGRSRRSSLRRADDDREDHFVRLYLKQRIRDRLVRSQTSRTVSRGLPTLENMTAESLDEQKDNGPGEMEVDEELLKELQEEVENELSKSSGHSSKVKEIRDLLSIVLPAETGAADVKTDLELEVRLENVTYSVELEDTESKIATVYNQSFLYPIYKWFKRVTRGEPAPVRQTTQFNVLENISLCLKPGVNYLVLGAPASGKSTLLKAIAGQLRPKSKKESLSGTILYNGRKLEASHLLNRGKKWYIENAIAYIDQLDKHHPRLTVEETFDFSFQCKTGGSLRYMQHKNALSSKRVTEILEKGDKEGVGVKIVLAALGLNEVKDTYVGDAAVRGVSGGQRRRVTVGEMTTCRQPVLCGDEISTGLDATSTFEMVDVLTYFGKLNKMTRVFALLQPSPETVSLFDEIILMGRGRILYAGPIHEVEQYFADLGYRCPQFMDVADFLQTVSSDDGSDLYQPSEDASSNGAPTIPELADMFRSSQQGRLITDRLKRAPSYVWKEEEGATLTGLSMSQQVERRYAISFFRSCSLNVRRALTLWKRDKRVLIAAAVKNILMGVSVGGVFSNVEDEISILGALFQAGLFIMLSAMQSANALVSDRVIFYKQMDAKFFSSWPFVIGKALAGFPQTIMDVFVFGTILYFMVGLSDRTVDHYFLFIAILVTFAMVMQMQLAVFASFSTETSLQVYSACILLLFILFGGFIVAPAAIPEFYLFVYWWNPFAWAYRALVINEFRSTRYSDADATLKSIGFTYGKDAVAFEQHWLSFCFVYMVFYFLACLVLTAIGLGNVRQTGEPTPPDAGMVERKRGENSESERKSKRIGVDLKRVDLSFQGVHYEVKASTKDEMLTLLRDVSGIFRSGRMCALMGNSGAGKSTLMDVISLRKRTGTVSGDVMLNGWPQEQVAFRRCSGYVFQFDVQSPELTVRETVLFSARLRLAADNVKTDEDLEVFVHQVLEDVGLNQIADSLVGTDEGIGLSFEQKKRLSIAVELAAAPSVIFADEPTSGLDGRSALIVSKALRKISDQGRTIVATIHQPSSVIFSMFDDLLLLKKGEVVYHGSLGENCEKVVNYFEGLGAPPIQLGENPANWVLRVINTGTEEDLVFSFKKSSIHRELREELDLLHSSLDPDLKIEYKNEFASSRRKRRLLILRRLRLIYWRSPAYNLSRLMVSLAIAFILGSVFILKRNQSSYDEVGMRSRLSVIFLTFIITGIMAILSVIPVMSKIRDMFYRHRDSGMYDSASIGWALGGAEKGFIIVSGMIFAVVFLAVAGLSENLRSLIGFWGYFTFNFAIYSYFGQAFVCAVQNQATALILSSVFIGLNNFFSGLIVLPQLMNSGFFSVPYYITPGHYVYEGMVVSVFWDNTKTVTADPGGDFNLQLIQAGQCVEDEPCKGTVLQFIQYFFDNNYVPDHHLRNTLILGLVLVLTRLLTFLALKYIRFDS